MEAAKPFSENFRQVSPAIVRFILPDWEPLSLTAPLGPVVALTDKQHLWQKEQVATSGQIISWPILHSWYMFSNNGHILPHQEKNKLCSRYMAYLFLLALFVLACFACSWYFQSWQCSTTAALSYLHLILFACQLMPHITLVTNIGNSSQCGNSSFKFTCSLMQESGHSRWTV